MGGRAGRGRPSRPAAPRPAGGGGWGLGQGEGGGGCPGGAAGTPVPTERGRWDTFYPAFAGAVRGDGPVPVDPADAIRTMTVLDAARTSARTGEAARL